MRTLALLLLVLVPVTASANPESELHRLKAQKYAELKEWRSASDEARAAVKADEKDREAWLILGIAEQRLENPGEAAKAYRQYLSLNPPEDKASAVRAKLAEVEVRQEVATSQEQRASLESHGPGSAGFALSYSPVFRPKAASDLVNDGGISSALGIHAHIGSFYMGVRFGGGDLATTIQAPPPGTDNEATATFSNVTLNSQSFFGADFGFQIGLNELYRSLGPVQLFVPIQSGFAIHTLKAEAVDRSFIGFAWDFATGIGATVYTSSVFNFELTALYHLSPQLVKAHESESQVGVRKLDGSETTSSLGGFELKLGLKLLFGNAD